MPEDSSWNLGQTIKDVADSYFGFRTAAAANNVRWGPAVNGVSYGYGVDGSVYTRGATAPVATSASSLVIIGLVIAAGVGLFLALKK